MSGIRERMNRLRGSASAASEKEEDRLTSGTENRGRNEAEAVRNDCPGTDRHSDAWTRLRVITETNEWGCFLLRQTVYPLDHFHGFHRLAELNDAVPPLKAFHSSASHPAPCIHNLLFLDLETTGLGVGAGNVPFMVGLGFVQSGRFVIEQYLIRHPAEERAMLAHLLKKLQQFHYLVTYNGKTFDWPVLAGRYIMNGFGRLEANFLHLDFLHPSRNIWRNTLTSCRLSHVEEERLGIIRKDDVPGSMAPALYFQFLSDGDPAPLEGVFLHNETDMLSLASLSIRFGRILGGRLGKDIPYPDAPDELLRIGLWLEKMNGPSAAEPLYRILAARDEIGRGWSLPLAARDKKIGNWERAVLLWQKTVIEAESLQFPGYEAHLELAMYYEHRIKDADAALRFAEAALTIALKRPANGGERAGRRSELDAIRKRIDRLRRKTAKENQKRCQ